MLNFIGRNKGVAYLVLLLVLLGTLGLVVRENLLCRSTSSCREGTRGVYVSGTCTCQEVPRGAGP